MHLILSAGVFVLTLALIFARPRGLSEAGGACLGAVAMLVVRLVTPGDIGQILGQTANVLLFLLGMMIVNRALVARQSSFEVSR